MAAGDLTRHFGAALVELLARRLEASGGGFDRDRFMAVTPRLNDLTLMKRIDCIAQTMDSCLPTDPSLAWHVMQEALPPPLGADGQTFNDGYWMLPLAAYWDLRCRGDVGSDVGLPRRAFHALAELTQRGTAEFAIRGLIARYPEHALERVGAWIGHSSFHVRRLASEGSRPFLPWRGRLRVDLKTQSQFLRMIRPLAHDDSAYVRRSVSNHVRDWRRIDESVAEAWLKEVDPPQEVRKRTLR